MARQGVRLSDAQWAKIEPHLPRVPRSPRGGRPWVEPSRRDRRHPLGAQDRRAVARLAERVSESRDVLASSAALGRLDAICRAGWSAIAAMTAIRCAHISAAGHAGSHANDTNTVGVTIRAPLL